MTELNENVNNEENLEKVQTSVNEPVETNEEQSFTAQNQITPNKEVVVTNEETETPEVVVDSTDEIFEKQDIISEPTEPTDVVIDSTDENLVNQEVISETIIEQTTDKKENVVETDLEVVEEEDKELQEVEEDTNFANLTKLELIRLAESVLIEKTPNEAIKVFREIQPLIDEFEKDEEANALQIFVEEGGEKDDFEYNHDGTKDWFYNTFKELKQKRNAEYKEAEAERLNNLKRKEEILEEIKALNESEETVNSLGKLKELQTEWKHVKNVPKEDLERLWETYRVYNEIFYDRLSINNELKELDRSKNLDHKIELIAEVSKLIDEPSIKKALIGVKKLQEDWKHIGPVAREASDDIWKRFKAEVDKVYTKIKEQTAQLDAIRQQNLEAKKLLIEKAKEMAETKNLRIKEWMEQTNLANDLMNEWKKIGHVPLSVRDEVWNEFKNYRNTFYQNKSSFFKILHAERNANLKAKTVLCERAESIASNPIDWNKLTNEIKDLQAQWKTVGPAPDKVNDAVWRRFRTACDLFFEKKAARYAEQTAEQANNLILKTQIIDQLKTLHESENVDNVFNQLKEIQTNWNAIGYVPGKEKDAINKKYNDLLDAIYGKYKQLNKEMRGEREKQHFELLATSPNGNQKLHREEKILQERIRSLKKDLETWDNNLGFFKSGNSANPLAEQIASKIEIAGKQIANLEEKLKSLKAIKNNN